MAEGKYRDGAEQIEKCLRCPFPDCRPFACGVEIPRNTEAWRKRRKEKEKNA